MHLGFPLREELWEAALAFQLAAVTLPSSSREGQLWLGWPGAGIAQSDLGCGRLRDRP